MRTSRLRLFLGAVTLLLGPMLLLGQNVYVNLNFEPMAQGGYISGVLDDWVTGNQGVSLSLYNRGREGLPIKILAELRLDGTLLASGVSGEIQLHQGDNPMFGTDFDFTALLNGSGYPNWDELIKLAPEILSSGSLPSGVLSICIRIRFLDLPNHTSPETCKSAMVTEFQPSTLITPIDEKIITFDHPIHFQWTTYTPSEGYLQNSELRIYEVYPGQEAIQAIRANYALVKETVTGVTAWNWPLMNSPLNPGDSMHCVWVIEAISPTGTVLENDERTSTPGEFWIKLPILKDDTFPPPCPTPDAGPDQVIKAGQQGSIHLGTNGVAGYTYTWASNPFGTNAFGPRCVVDVPTVSTRYGVTMVDSSGRCSTYDEAWVLIIDSLNVKLKKDVCGKIEVQVSHPPKTKSTNSAGAQDTAIVVNGVTYTFSGLSIGGNPPLNPDCYPKLPPSTEATPVANLPYTCLWSTGDTGRVLIPSKPGTYSVTVSDGYSSDTASVVVTMEGKYWDPFYPITVTSNMVAGDISRQFVVGNYDKQKEINAFGYEVKVKLPSGREHILKGDTTSGFQRNGIRWDGRLENGAMAQIGECQYTINLLGCAHPIPDDKETYYIHELKYFAGPGGTTTEEVGFEKTNKGALEITERVNLR